MYSTYSKKENAHDEAGWCCAWKRFEPSEEAMDTSENPENGGENKENEEDQSRNLLQNLEKPSLRGVSEY